MSDEKPPKYGAARRMYRRDEYAQLVAALAPALIASDPRPIDLNKDDWDRDIMKRANLMAYYLQQLIDQAHPMPVEFLDPGAMRLLREAAVRSGIDKKTPDA